MQTIFFPRETANGENRASLVPSSAKRLCALGFRVLAGRSIGARIGIGDVAYGAAGVELVNDFASGAVEADVVARVKCSRCEEIARMKHGAVHISFLEAEKCPGEIKAFRDAGVAAISLEMVPRSTAAQKFDALSSQANLAGYAAVLLAAMHMDRAFPMMMTPAGTIYPVNVLVIGAGVAGLQAIATAKRLGARVEAFDTRPETEEQVKSLGAKFLKIDIGEVGQTEQGYAKELSEEQMQMQREGMVAACRRADIVIAMAKVFGKTAPVLLTKEMLDRIDKKTLFVDTAIASGGNVEGAVDGLVDYSDCVKIFGVREAEQSVAASASQTFAENVCNFIEHFCDSTSKRVVFDRENDIIARCLVA
ncbi:MAG: NAD(P) transhydrogenase subunit alpha [Puniceicoccales bacterium]|nr:NAD(P) transhydrogenase subunit alpha [Puniceicoccales bacterium]